MPTLELQLDLVDVEVHVRLRNTGSATALVLHDIHVQPTRPVLRDAQGNEVPVFDERSRMKFDNRIFESMFVSLPPGGSLDLETASFERERRRWSFRWGNFSYEGLEPGDYELHFVWDSKVAEVLDDDSEATKPVPGVWLGELRSDVESIQLR
ncbi:hypothetical protein ACNOYE_32345 [Nannocystaceae bacterium ST9]